MANNKYSLLDLAKISKLGYGIHDNILITKVDTEDRKRQGVLEKKMLYTTFAVIDPKTSKKKASIELSWFRLDPVSDFFFTNMRELCVQLSGILGSFMDEEKVYNEMESIFEGFNFKSVDDIENHKWKKKDVDTLTNKLKTKYGELIAPFINDTDNLIRVKITTDNKGEHTNIPKFGIFTESMAAEKSALKFSDFEKRNHSKAGIGANGSSDPRNL